MIVNNIPKTDPKHGEVKEFVKYLQQATTTCVSVNKSVFGRLPELDSDMTETKFEMSSLLNHLRQCDPDLETARNFLTIKDKLMKIAEVRKESRDEALRLIQEKKVARAEINAKVNTVKSEIDDLAQENKAMLEKLNDTNLPLLCSLFKHEK